MTRFKRLPLAVNLMMLFTALLFFSCEKSEDKVETESKYIISVTPVSNSNAPALQSFAHGIHDGKWLLFADRTNQDLDEGGLHDLNGNYTSTSFVPMSYNQEIMVYDVANDALQGMTLETMLNAVKKINLRTRHFIRP